MTQKNPILPGFHADPCLCRRGDDFFLAVSSFEWFPGVPVYHSRDLRHWELYAHCLTDDGRPDQRGLPSAKGIWAPCLTYCAADGLFYLVYGVMRSTNARFFDVNNCLITAPDPRGPWSAPVYVGSAGFDASLFHDDDGRKWLVSLEWECRTGYEQPGAICLAEYDPVKKRLKSAPRRIYTGGTARGCIEGPHLYKRGGWYYLLCAEGGTGYGHCVTMARARSVNGPFAPDPENPILTSSPAPFSARGETDFLKPERFNPASVLQKSGHASLVETPLGETYLAHLCARPFLPELRCTLGRECALQRMEWTPDGWLRLAGGGNLARERTQSSALPDCAFPALPAREDFTQPLRADWYSPRISSSRFAHRARGWLVLRGQESLCSLNEVSLLAKKLRSVQTQMAVRLRFSPEAYQHSAGLVLYYDNMNWAFLRKYWSQTLGAPALGILRVRNGEKSELARTPCPPGDVWLRLSISGRESVFCFSADGRDFTPIGPAFDTSEFSDEFCTYGEFTGAFAGLACVDSLLHEKKAQFRDFIRTDDPAAPVR